ncbi:MAG: ATP-binding cassette domain-containing protein [Deltaproteobacteria bacterium]|nr:ATP-binding cassette domain-containing protein [Deltaproteobacteria bacterium]
MPVINAREVSKSYGPKTVLDGISLSIDEGERVGLVGLNGSGKSTLARILAGLEEADAGTITRRRDSRIAYLSQTPGFIVDRTAREEVLAGLTAWRAAKERFDALGLALAEDAGASRLEALLASHAEAQGEVERLGGFDLDHRAETILGHLDVPADKRLTTLSGGESRRVALAQILVSGPDLAILDEPTNHLDITTIEWLERTLAEGFPGAVLLVTHDRAFLDRLAERTTEIDQGKLFSYAGGYAAYVEARAARINLEDRTESNRQNYLRHEVEWLRRQPKARTGKQKARIGRIHTALADTPTRRDAEVQLRAESSRLGKTILELSDLEVCTPDHRVLVRDLDFTLTRGQRVGILGPNGCGKTTLLRTITGALDPEKGTIVRGKNTRFSYLSQTREDLDESATILENIVDGRTSISLGGQDIEFHAYLQRFLFRRVDHSRPVSSLSGGEKSRVALARMLARPANLVILDEPTNDLDVATIAALESLLTDFNGTALVVTHDRWFLDRVATQMLVFEDDAQVTLFPGNYTTYRALATEAQTRQAAEAQTRQAAEAHTRQAAQAHTRQAAARATGKKARKTSPTSHEATEAPPKPRKLTYAEALELESIEARIEAADQRVKDLEVTIADPDLYQRSRHAEATKVAAALDEARAEAAHLISRWEDLETRRETFST